MNRLERAIFILEEDASLAKDAKPLILEAVLTRPVLAWAVERLRSDGVRRFFAVCGPRFSGEVAGLLPPEAVVSERWTDLEAFLDTGEPVLVLPRAAFPMAEAGPGFAYAAPGRELRETWRTRMTNQVQGAELVPGWLPVYGPETLAEIETLVRGRDIDCPEGH
ncbi:MAG: hypothetical protein HFG04_01180 [Oscillibacter sp.]|jgi:bifunctional UDP-N-acetylglucosamine pyrophosphorylase/glucosamine-1-phosphate N-acetyltransferase|nr:hypothetical protein [Oscillibacter sp.]MCI9001469.1 hypothetical protein [Oscillibacter sp.]